MYCKQGVIMIASTNFINPTPSDFGDYVYCPRSWALDKNPLARRKKELRGASYDKKEGNEPRENLKIGQSNENKCINWVLDKYRINTDDILFNGTGQDNLHFLSSENQTLNFKIQCKPDLIFKYNNRIHLFEFKAVKHIEYLEFEEFDSVQAQVWCYTFIKEFNINSCSVLKYFKDPFTKACARPREISALVFNSLKYENLFSNYIKAIEVISSNGKIGDSSSVQSMPTNRKDSKCRHCAYNDLFCNPRHLENYYG